MSSPSILILFFNVNRYGSRQARGTPVSVSFMNSIAKSKKSPLIGCSTSVVFSLCFLNDRLCLSALIPFPNDCGFETVRFFRVVRRRLRRRLFNKTFELLAI